MFLLFLTGCGSFPGTFGGGKWNVSRVKETRGTVYLAAVSADKPGSAISLEKEIADMAPLLFLERGYIPLPGEGGAEYLAEVQAREREYTHGWKTRRSLSVEVRIWPAAGTPNEVPLAAGQALSLGNRSLASSKTLGRMLALAIKKAVKGLPNPAGLTEREAQ